MVRLGEGGGINNFFPTFSEKPLLFSKENRTFAPSKETLIT